MSGPRKAFDLNAPPEGTKVKKVEFEAVEDPDDKELRLRKELWTFLVKDLATYCFALLSVAVVGGYCGYEVIRYGAASPEAKQVWPFLTLIIGAVVGTVFGRATAK